MHIPRRFDDFNKNAGLREVTSEPTETTYHFWRNRFQIRGTPRWSLKRENLRHPVSLRALPDPFHTSPSHSRTFSSVSLIGALGLSVLMMSACFETQKRHR